MTRRTVLVAVMAWVAVVALGSVGTWTVIDSAGQHVLGRPGARLVTEQPAPGPGQSPTAAHRSRPPQPSPSPSPHTASQSAAPPPSARPSPAPPPASYLERAWRGTSGAVVVRCSAAKASLASATPSDGYRVEVGARGPGAVQVTFKGHEREVQVRAECAGEVPRFSVEGSSED